jgi:hypothetical protein
LEGRDGGMAELVWSAREGRLKVVDSEAEVGVARSKAGAGRGQVLGSGGLRSRLSQPPTGGEAARSSSTGRRRPAPLLNRRTLAQDQSLEGGAGAD